MRNYSISTALAAVLITSATIASAQPQTQRGGHARQPPTAEIFRDREPYYIQGRRDGFFSQPFGQQGTIRWNTPHANGGLGNPNGGGGNGSP